MLPEEGVTDDGRWILMMRCPDVFCDGFVLREFEDSAGLGLTAMLVWRWVVGSGGRLPYSLSFVEGAEGDD